MLKFWLIILLMTGLTALVLGKYFGDDVYDATNKVINEFTSDDEDETERRN